MLLDKVTIMLHKHVWKDNMYVYIYNIYLKIASSLKKINYLSKIIWYLIYKNKLNFHYYRLITPRSEHWYIISFPWIGWMQTENNLRLLNNTTIIFVNWTRWKLILRIEIIQSLFLSKRLSSVRTWRFSFIITSTVPAFVISHLE